MKTTIANLTERQKRAVSAHDVSLSASGPLADLNRSRSIKHNTSGGNSFSEILQTFPYPLPSPAHSVSLKSPKATTGGKKVLKSNEFLQKRIFGSKRTTFPAKKVSRSGKKTKEAPKAKETMPKSFQLPLKKGEQPAVEEHPREVVPKPTPRETEAMNAETETKKSAKTSEAQNKIQELINNFDVGESADFVDQEQDVNEKENESLELDEKKEIEEAKQEDEEADQIGKSGENQEVTNNQDHEISEKEEEEPIVDAFNESSKNPNYFPEDLDSKPEPDEATPESEDKNGSEKEPEPEYSPAQDSLENPEPNQSKEEPEPEVHEGEAEIHESEAGIHESEAGIHESEAGINQQESEIHEEEVEVNQESEIREEEAEINQQESEIREEEDQNNRSSEYPENTSKESTVQDLQYDNQVLNNGIMDSTNKDKELAEIYSTPHFTHDENEKNGQTKQVEILEDSQAEPIEDRKNNSAEEIEELQVCLKKEPAPGKKSAPRAKKGSKVKTIEFDFDDFGDELGDSIAKNEDTPEDSIKIEQNYSGIEKEQEQFSQEDSKNPEEIQVESKKLPEENAHLSKFVKSSKPTEKVPESLLTRLKSEATAELIAELKKEMHITPEKNPKSLSIKIEDPSQKLSPKGHHSTESVDRVLAEEMIKRMLFECLSTKNKEEVKLYLEPMRAINTPSSKYGGSKRTQRSTDRPESKVGPEPKPEVVDFAIKNYLKGIIDGMQKEDRKVVREEMKGMKVSTPSFGSSQKKGNIFKFQPYKLNVLHAEVHSGIINTCLSQSMVFFEQFYLFCDSYGLLKPYGLPPHSFIAYFVRRSRLCSLNRFYLVRGRDYIQYFTRHILYSVFYMRRLDLLPLVFALCLHLQNLVLFHYNLLYHPFLFILYLFSIYSQILFTLTFALLPCSTQLIVFSLIPTIHLSHQKVPPSFYSRFQLVPTALFYTY
eukprot:TRINITY_DN29_c0_g1_i2.p1 TRINITY_DN29_c0_g1~~TRINITY_DN29_c0_g1_i2.p1  ORF type:complete len:943 (-),score=125.84 TRINITY_DN29_c0_g1_i2:1008-3836(-)